jgi:hypothetical protein
MHPLPGAIVTTILAREHHGIYMLKIAPKLVGKVHNQTFDYLQRTGMSACTSARSAGMRRDVETQELSLALIDHIVTKREHADKHVLFA